MFNVEKTNGEVIEIQNPSELPEQIYSKTIFEPYVKATILVPDEFLGNVIKLLNDKRGIQIKWITEKFFSGMIYL